MARRAIPWVLAFAALVAFYLSVGLVLAPVTRVFETEWLSIDADKVARMLADPTFVGLRHRQLAHPLFDLFLRPLGVPLAAAVGLDRGALVLTAAFAALGVLGFRAVLALAGVPASPATATALLLAVSTPHVLYGALPETFIFSFASLMLPLLAYLGVASDRRFVPALAVATFVAAGITTTNLVLGLICLAARLWRLPRAEQARHAATFVGASAVLWGAALAVERALYPAMPPLLGGDVVSAHGLFIGGGLSEGIGRAVLGLVPYFVVYDVVAPEIVPNPASLWDTYGLAGAVPVRFVAAAAVYAAFVAAAAWATWTGRTFARRLFAILAVYFAFNLVLHVFYGLAEPHLYGAHYAFAWLALLALPFARDAHGRGPSPRTLAVLTALLAATGVAVAANNLAFLRQIATRAW